jgi:hypothetical protein
MLNACTVAYNQWNTVDAERITNGSRSSGQFRRLVKAKAVAQHAMVAFVGKEV